MEHLVFIAPIESDELGVDENVIADGIDHMVVIINDMTIMKTAG